MAIALGSAAAGLGSFGGANFWNPVGWVCLGIAAVAAIGYVGYKIYENWDAICDFFSWGTTQIQMSLITTLAVGIVLLSSATSVWDTTAPATTATPSLAKTPDGVDTRAKDIVETIAKTQALTRGPWNVYDLHVGMPGRFNDYVRGAGFSKINLFLGAIYKYGITMKESVRARYAKALDFPGNTKDIYIYRLIASGKLSPFQWYLYRYNQPVARAAENALISAYAATHGGAFPPGNTGLY